MNRSSSIDAQSLVSVVIPVHNRLDVLKECLASVARQVYSKIEVIIVDDASEGNVHSVLEAIDWPSTFVIHFLCSDINLGPGASRERGRQKASGEFICYLDSDDIWHPEKVAAQVELLKLNLDAGMCYCKSTEFSELPITGDEPLHSSCDKTFTEFLPCVLDGRPWGTAACMWRQSATDAIGPWLEEWGWEDCEYDCRAGCLEIRICHLRRVLCYYRRDEANDRLTRTPGKAYSRGIRALDSILHHLRDCGNLSDLNVATALAKVLLNFGKKLMKYERPRESAYCLRLLFQNECFPTSVRWAGFKCWLAMSCLGAKNGFRIAWRVRLDAKCKID